MEFHWFIEECVEARGPPGGELGNFLEGWWFINNFISWVCKTASCPARGSL